MVQQSQCEGRMLLDGQGAAGGVGMLLAQLVVGGIGFFCLLLSLAFGHTHTGMKKQCGLSCSYARKAVVGRARARALIIKSR